MLCQLSYIGLRRFAASADSSACLSPFAPTGGTPGLPGIARSEANDWRSLERETGIEPATNSLEGCDSTTELLPPSLNAPLLHCPMTQFPNGGEGRIRTFEGAGPTDLQSAAFDRFATSPIALFG